TNSSNVDQIDPRSRKRAIRIAPASKACRSCGCSNSATTRKNDSLSRAWSSRTTGRQRLDVTLSTNQSLHLARPAGWQEGRRQAASNGWRGANENGAGQRESKRFADRPDRGRI